MRLSQYVRRRTGLPLGAKGSLRAMLVRSLGAGTFAGFWRHWNPIFSYGLGRFVYRPVRRVTPAAIALLVTFAASGAIHDAVALAFWGSTAFLFTSWFVVLGAVVLGEQAMGWDAAERPWWLRAVKNLAYLAAGQLLVLAVRAVG